MLIWGLVVKGSMMYFPSVRIRDEMKSEFE